MFLNNGIIIMFCVDDLVRLLLYCLILGIRYININKEVRISYNMLMIKICIYDKM